MGKRINLRQFR